MALDPLQIAIWRFERIAPLLEPSLLKAERSQLLSTITSQSVRWPSGRENPIDRSTIYLWLKQYQTNRTIEALLPVTRKRKPCVDPSIKPEWLTFALGLLEEEPARSLFILSKRIAIQFNLPKLPPRSSLHRALCVTQRYQIVRKTIKKGKFRTRFVAAQIHQIWHGDAKADFKATFTDGTTRNFRILSLLDDCSRYILAALVIESESLSATVKTFQHAVRRFGLPLCFYADRGSPYDSTLFRQALAILGVRRINTKPRNPSAHGKIEAYHRTLHRWFIKELRHQPLRDVAHLQMLLDAMIDTLYHQHIHQELKSSPAVAFNNTISQRIVSLQRLHEVFLARCTLLPERKTGNVRLGGTLFHVPSEYLVPRRRLRFAYDLVESQLAYLIDGAAKLVPLHPAVRITKLCNNTDALLPIGSLSPLLETYRGRVLPRPVAGFGLPEIYAALASALHRNVPETEAEGSLVITWLRKWGPFQPEAFNNALAQVFNHIGQGRPLPIVLEELARSINTQH